MITTLRHGTTKNGKPYGVFTIEDYDGAHEFPLFGNNYLEFSKYMIQDLYVMIYAIVQEKGSDYRYKAPRNPNLPKVWELKIQKIEMLDEVKDKLVEKLTLSIPLEQLDEELCDSLIDLINTHKGKANLYFDLIDLSTQERLKFLHV